MDQNADRRYKKWKSALVPVYGERETANMWRWYNEARRADEIFDKDLDELADHYPIQYLTGYSWFYGEKFLVNEHTLIPRPETEELVYLILESHGDREDVRVIDLGTGSGCIAVTLKKKRPHWHVTGMDLYADTLEMARRNGAHHQVDVEWRIGDILQLDEPLLSDYDMIVSNPPYIRPDERSTMDENVVKYEPHQALFTDDPDGLEFYRAIAGYGAHLSKKGCVYLEIHPHSSRQIAGLFKDSGLYQDIEVHQDLQGRDRMLKAVRRISH